MKGKVLFVDDDISKLTKYCVMQLKRRGFEVDPFLGNNAVSNVLEHLEIRRPHIDIGILDVMMPPGAHYEDEDTDGGLNTGLYLYRDIRRKYPKIPIIIYSQVLDTGVANLFPKESRLRLLAKNEYDVVALAKVAEEFMDEMSLDKPSRNQQPQSSTDESTDPNTLTLYAHAEIEAHKDDYPLYLNEYFKLIVSISDSSGGPNKSSPVLVTKVEQISKLMVTVFAQDFEISPLGPQFLSFEEQSLRDFVEFSIRPIALGSKSIMVEFFYRHRWLSQIHLEVFVAMR